jgi:hypothetical protein
LLVVLWKAEYNGVENGAYLPLLVPLERKEQ